MSGATPGSGAAVGPDEKEGRLMLPQAARNTARAEAAPRLTTVRTLRDLIMASPRTKIPWPHPSRSQAQNCCRSNDVQLITLAPQSGFRSILHRSHQGLK